MPYQIVELASPRAPIRYAAGRYARGQFNPWELLELHFVAEDVPLLGWKTYRVVPREQRPKFESGIVTGRNSLENRFFKVVLDPQTGGIASLYDKELDRELVDRAAQHKLNQFVARWIKSGKLAGPTNVTIQPGPGGPVCASLVVQSQGPGCPQITQQIVIYDRLKRIDLANRVLKDSTPLLEVFFAFPFKVDPAQFRFEGTCSVIEPLRDQFPGSNSNYYAVQHWADASNGQFGITLAPIDSHLLMFGGLWPTYVSQAHHGVTPPDFGKRFVTGEQRRIVSGWPLPMPRSWKTLVNEPQTEGELEAIRRSASRSRPCGKDDWVKATAAQLGLESTLRSRGRPRKQDHAGWDADVQRARD